MKPVQSLSDPVQDIKLIPPVDQCTGVRRGSLHGRRIQSIFIWKVTGGYSDSEHHESGGTPPERNFQESTRLFWTYLKWITVISICSALD
jgi:hypothetical protein